MSGPKQKAAQGPTAPTATPQAPTPEAVKAALVAGAKAIDRAKMHLVLNLPWFAALALRLTVRPTDTLPTAATDGRSLYYNPAWLSGLSSQFWPGILAHEVMHCALFHMTRRGERDHALWNMAGDHVINLQLKAANIPLPADCLCDPQYANMTTDEVYRLLREQHQKRGGGLVVYIDPMGGVQDAPKEGGGGRQGKDGNPTQGQGAPTDEPGDLETQWSVAVKQATAACDKAGTTPDNIARAVNDAQATNVDWRAVLADYLTRPGDYSWSVPNRRHIGRGLYLPGTVNDAMGLVVLAVDTSGSITPDMLNLFNAEVQDMLRRTGWPERCLVLYADTRVQREQELLPGDLLECQGGGGTAFQPTFDYLAEQGVTPDVFVYFTDLESPDVSSIERVDYPVLWVTPQAPSRYYGGQPNVGRVVVLQP